MKFYHYYYFIFLILCLKSSNVLSQERDDSLKLVTQQKQSCISLLPEARKIYQSDSNNISALKIIADCTENSENINQYATNAKEIFEQSRFLSIIPHLLEMAQIKDLIPIIKEVEIKKDKSINDYLMLNEIYDRLGDPEKQITNLKEAINISPNDPRPLLLLAIKKLNLGEKEEAFIFFRNYLEKAPKHPGQVYLMAYIFALVNPLLSSLALLLLIWFLGYRLLLIDKRGAGENLDMRLGIGFVLFLAPLILSIRFAQTSTALPFGALLLILFIELFFTFQPRLKKYYEPIINFLKKIIQLIFNSLLLSKSLEKLSSSLRVIIGLTAVTVLGFIAPTILVPDLKFAVMGIASVIFYATLGSLLVSFIRSRRSLVFSLRWISIAATLPFLISYLISNWSSLGEPMMFARLPSQKVLDSLYNYLLFWGVSLLLALQLGKIIAQALIEPIQEIVKKVERIEIGDWSAKVNVFSQDELGNLGHAINRMRDGLERREKVEKTFSKYIDKKIADRILDGCESEMRIEGQKCHAVILFADIRGYTSLSEKTEALVVVKLLNEYFEMMVRIVQKYGGVVDKFIGDNLMAVWGIPNAIEDAEEKAVTAALEMLKEINKWSEGLKEKGYPDLAIGIGINAGSVIAGSLGSSEHMEYTVIGDAVNSAQRAEAHAGRQELLITDTVYKFLGNKVEALALDPIKVKGKELVQQYWSVKKIFIKI